MKQASSGSHGSKEKHRRSKSDDSKRHPALEASHTKSQKQSQHDYKEMDIELPEVKTLLEQLPKEYKPISSFVDDKEELIEQLFTCITGSDLTQMIPKALRGYGIDELKKLCFHELKRMSKGLILHVLQGEDPSSFVEEKLPAGITREGEKRISDATQENPTLKRKLQEGPAAAYSDERNPKRCALEEIPLASEQTTPERSDSASNEAFLELYPSTKEMETLAEIDKQKDLPAQEGGKDLELLELEMRARAIRSLLRARGLPSSEDEEEREKDL